MQRIVHLISVHAPKDCKPSHEKDKFYDVLCKIVNSIDPKNLTMIMGDLNVQVGNDIIPGIKQQFSEI